MVLVNALGSVLISVPPCWGTNVLTTTVATSATTEMPTHASRKRQRIRAATEASQPGRSPCSQRVSSQVIGMAVASTRLT